MKGARALGAAALLCLGCAAPGPPRLPVDPGTLYLGAPAPDAELRQLVPLVEVCGRAPRGRLAGVDAVLALDLSNTTLHASGLDVDGDGTTGETRSFVAADRHWDRPAARWTTDPDDTIARAELHAGLALADELDARASRLGLVTFTGRARERVAVGAPARTRSALAELELGVDRTGTNLAAAVRRARTALREAPPPPGCPRPKAVLLFSDGEPTVPRGETLAANAARQQAAAAAREGIAVHTFGFGPAREDPGVLAELAALSGGRHRAVSDPAAPLEPPASAGIETIELLNETTGATGRAVRWFPNGSFDGFVPLEPGPNRIVVRVRLTDGRRLEAVRHVPYRPPDAPNEADRRAAAELLAELQRRTLAFELAPLPPRRGQRELEVETERNDFP